MKNFEKIIDNIIFSYEEVNNQDNLITKQHVKYSIYLEYKDNYIEFDYQCNPYFCKPNLLDCLYCLLCDSQSYEKKSRY